MTPEAFAEQLRQEGFEEVADKSLPAGQFVDTHTHPFAVKAMVTGGEVALGVAGRVTTYRVGDVFTMAPGCEHTEQYGAQGVSYVVGRKYG
jgi:quercetin dioxygenase-like cupin family protein